MLYSKYLDITKSSPGQVGNPGFKVIIRDHFTQLGEEIPSFRVTKRMIRAPPLRR